MKELKAVNKYFIKYKYLLILGFFFVITSNIFGLFTPEYIRYSIDILEENLAIYHLADGFQLQALFEQKVGFFILFFAGIILTTSLIKGILMFFMRQTLIVMSRKVEYDQKNELYQHYQRLNTTFYKRNNTGDLMSRISEDVSRVRMYIGPAVMYLINTTALFAMVIYVMFDINFFLSLLVLLPLPILVFSIYKTSNIINIKSERISIALSNLTSRAQEVFSGIRVIQSFAIDKQIQEEFHQASEAYKKQNISLAKTDSFFMPLMVLLIGLSMLLVIYIGGIEIQNGSFTTGNIAEFVFYINMLTWPVASLGWCVSLIQRAEASQKRINQFLQDKNEIKYNSEILLNEIKSIQFKDVTFIYPDTGIQALSNINLTIQKGEKVAIIGKTGSGKSTIAELILRTYDIEYGEIKINQHALSKINLEDYRAKIGYTPQDIFLFSDTINNNISFGSEQTSEEKIIEYAKVAHVHNDIQQLTNKYKTIVGERGVMLSGGQKQRISIARSLFRNPEFILLDDCLSAVDAHTEKTILTNLNKTLLNKTVVFITHRIFAIMNFDKILVLDDGKIVEQGKHQELLNLRGIYYDLYQLQQAENVEV
ncbi:MAG TPA: ABC transporter ATP-binding protein [Chitinophagales bacterium]|nr:ABC transporter ATP-binding protein [Chitinophagales bacterium]HQV77583.1 ABC transporter ATP-binding protein [Chitinophagales bacterium]HQW79592.1 ABC transporter ATP-binding protein [Chitinophagales bacterium]